MARATIALCKQVDPDTLHCQMLMEAIVLQARDDYVKAFIANYHKKRIVSQFLRWRPRDVLRDLERFFAYAFGYETAEAIMDHLEAEAEKQIKRSKKAKQKHVVLSHKKVKKE